MTTKLYPEKQYQSESPLGKYLREKYLFRGEGGMTQKELAERMKVSRQTVNNLVTGRRSLSLKLAKKLSDSFGETLDFWITLEHTRNEDYSEMRDELGYSAKKLLKRLNKIGQHTLVDYEIREAITSGLIGMKNFSDTYVQPASYDLRAGEGIIYLKSGDPTAVNLAENSLIFKPDTLIVLRTYEELIFPIEFLGRLGIMTSLSTQGIYVSHGIHVDPGFKGYLWVTAINVSGIEHVMKPLQPCLSLEINYLATTPQKGYNGPNQNRTEFLDVEKDIVRASRR